MTIILLVISCISVLAAVEAAVERRRLGARLDRARRELPKDEATGLLNHRAFRQRILGEIKRAKRGGGSVWLSVWTVVDGDPDQFGRVAADGLRFPETGFRLAERVFCFTRPNATDEHRGDLARRLRQGAPRARAAVGEARWAGGSVEDAMALLHEAIGDLH